MEIAEAIVAMPLAEANPRNNSYEGNHIRLDHIHYNSYEGDYGLAHGHKDMKHVGQGVGLTLRPRSHHTPSPRRRLQGGEEEERAGHKNPRRTII